MLRNPWFRFGVNAWSLGIEASSVIALRTLKILAEQYQALIDYLGGKEGGQILDIMRRADGVHINRNDIETGKAA